jgi:hypothetical protein
MSVVANTATATAAKTIRVRSLSEILAEKRQRETKTGSVAGAPSASATPGATPSDPPVPERPAEHANGGKSKPEEVPQSDAAGHDPLQMQHAQPHEQQQQQYQQSKPSSPPLQADEQARPKRKADEPLQVPDNKRPRARSVRAPCVSVHLLIRLGGGGGGLSLL